MSKSSKLTESLFVFLFSLGQFVVASQSSLVNLTLSATAVEVSGSFNLSVEFVFDSGTFTSFKCGYGTESSHTSFAEFNRHAKKFQLITSGFPASYTKRVTFPSAIKMTISKVPFEDEGTNYLCEYQYYDGAPKTVYSNNPNITAVYASPVFGLNLFASNSDIIEGRNTTLKCTVTSRPASSIMWSYDSASITATQSTLSVTNGYYTSVTGILAILNVDWTMNGKQVTCMGMPVYGQKIMSSTTLRVFSSSQMVNVTLSPTAVEVGGSFNLSVEFLFDSGIFTSLKCGYGTESSHTTFAEFNRHTRKFQLITSGFPASYTKRVTFPGAIKMIISKVPFEDEGTNYLCEYQYYDGAPKTVYSNNPNITAVYASPVFGLNSLASNSEIIEGQNTTLKCNVTSRPASSIMWSYDSASITATQSTSSVINGYYASVIGMLQINNVDMTMNGKQVTCKGIPVYGQNITNTTTLNVSYKPASVALTASTLKPLNGGSVILNCTSSARPAASYKFYRVTSSTETEIPNNGSGELTISPINYVNVGGYKVTYKCMAFNMIGSEPAANVELDIQVPPQLSVSGNQIVNKGENALFTCNVTAANPPANINWVNASNTQLSHSNGTLTLVSVTRHNTGKYTCKANNGVTGSPVTKSVTLTVQFAPENANLISDTALTVQNGSSITLRCTSLAVPAAEYMFYETIGGVTKMVSSSNSQSTGVLIIANIQTDLSIYKTMYKCMAKNSLGNGTMQMLEFNVLVPPSDVIITPNTNSHTVNETENVMLNCSVKYGNPKPSITWTSSVNSDSFSGSKISLNPVNRNDAKTYTCTAANSVATKRRGIVLTVQYGPEMVGSSNNITFIKCETQSVNLTCITNGIPTPDIQLKYNDTVSASGKGSVYHVIPSLAANQFGLYLCVISNVLKRMDIARVIVKPVKPGTVQSLAIKSDKGEFEVSWIAPVCKSSSGIKQYRISHKKTGAALWEKTSLTSTSPFKITDLEDGEDYTISVAVVANSGTVGDEETNTAKATGKKASTPKPTTKSTPKSTLKSTLKSTPNSTNETKSPYLYAFVTISAISFIIILILGCLEFKTEESCSKFKSNINTFATPADNYMDLQNVDAEPHPYARINNANEVKDNSHYMELTEKRTPDQQYATLSVYD